MHHSCHSNANLLKDDRQSRIRLIYKGTVISNGSDRRPLFRQTTWRLLSNWITNDEQDDIGQCRVILIQLDSILTTRAIALQSLSSFDRNSSQLP